MMWTLTQSIRRVGPGLGLLSLMSACQPYPTLSGAPAGAAPMTGTVLVTPELADARRVLALVPVIGAADVHHLVIQLFKLAGGVEVERSAIDVTDAAKFNAPVGFTHLHADTTYRVRATAYQSAGTSQPISVPAASYVDVAVGHDDRPTLAKLRVTLADVPFDALGTTGGVTVLDGGYMLELRGIVTTLAGTGTPGSDDGRVYEAGFTTPTGVAVDATGALYVTDAGAHRLRKITAAGAVSTLVGSAMGDADGTGTGAQLTTPTGVAVAATGTLYVSETAANRIRKVAPDGTTSVFAGGTSGAADGTGPDAQFNAPAGLALDGAGNLYVADAGNHAIRKITPAGVVTTLAGGARGRADGAGPAAQFDTPSGIAVGGGGALFVSDTNNRLIRRVTAAGDVTTLAGGSMGFADGTRDEAMFNLPRGLAVDARGNLYVADEGNHAIRKVTAAGVVTTLAGGAAGYVDGTGASARFVSPHGLALDGAGALVVCDGGDSRLRKVQ